MTYKLERLEGELDSLAFEAQPRDVVVEAIDAECSEDGFSRVAPEDLPPFGRWFHGEEAPNVRRFLVAPSSGRWTVVLPSARDWDAEWCQRLARRLACRGVSCMLHDGDVLSLDVVDSSGKLHAHRSSADYFDLAPGPTDALGFDPAVLLPFCRPGATTTEVVAALTPPGRFDIDGARAHADTLALLQLPPAASGSYRMALRNDGRSPLPSFADYEHLCYRETDPSARQAEAVESRAEDDDAGDQDSVVLPFRSRR